MRGNTGDAYAIAARAGAKLVGMEQIQFIPFAVTSPPSYEGLVIGEPVSAGLLGVIRDVNGKLVKGELMVRTRAECAAAIAIAVAEGRGTPNGGCYLDLTENAKGSAGEIFKSLMNDKLGDILDIVKPALGKRAANFEEPWEVRPSAHYCMGGVCSTDQGQALDAHNRIIPGLFVAGQALGGLHGSNRLGSTSLAESVIFGRRAGHGAARFSLARRSEGAGVDAEDASVSERFEHSANGLLAYYAGIPGRAGEVYPIHLIRDLQASCWQGIGPVRTGRGIRETLADIDRIEARLEFAVAPAELDWNQGFINYIECRNMLQCARQIAVSALFRTRNLGAHVRLDEEKGGEETAFSVSCYLEPGAGLKVGTVPRPASPRSEKLKAALALALRKAFLNCCRDCRSSGGIPCWLKSMSVPSARRQVRSGRRSRREVHDCPRG
jgi:succinate dehydrogenase/fumarate reductase flavoprotein subunit